ncbi:MAG TPA: TMEM175 family protein [Rickettsiales bacterium]|nr:TMEM175 family protein [Rickettsiales bacterium]
MKKPFHRFLRGDLPLNRIEALSDGVFAIIVTLLVLDLKTPELHDPKSVMELWHSLLAQAPRFLSWLISFVIVCKFWLNHHHLLRLARSADYGMIWLNSIFLMFQSFVPFPTALMGSYPDNALAVSFFGLVMAFNTLLFIGLKAYIVRRRIKPEMAEFHVPGIVALSFVGPAGYLLGAAFAWWNVAAAFVFYVVTPWFFIVPPQETRRA